MVVRSWHVGDVIRKLREQHEQHALTTTSLARKAGLDLQRSVGTEVQRRVSLERQGPEIEGITPSQWRALDRVAAVLGLANGASLYKQIPNAVDLTGARGTPGTAGKASTRVLRFTKK